MSDLDLFLKYLGERKAVVVDVEKQLCALQEKYETFFSEIERTRESELQQLRAHLADPATTVPGDLAEELAVARQAAAEDLDRQLAALEERHAAFLDQAEAVRSASRATETDYREANATMDAEEEQLKARNEALLVRIGEYNERIRSMARGFGFFLNLFRMRQLRAERKALDDEQADVAARIDVVRRGWARTDEGRAKEEGQREADWVRLKTEADAVQAKLDHIRSTRTRLVERTALELVLFERRPSLRAATDADPPCPRCGRPNPDDHHFCHICAQRLRDDRPDFEGSLLEVAEVNVHHARFSDGVKACQELIGLVRGLKTGVEAFSKSVKDVKKTEDKYPLPKLKIAVPTKAVSWGTVLDTLRDQVVAKDRSLHPNEFAKDIRAFATEKLDEKAIQTWFETMGKKLTQCADSQW